MEGEVLGDASAENNNNVSTGTDSGPENGKENQESGVERTDSRPGDVGKATPAPTQPGEQPDTPITVAAKEPDRQSESRPRKPRTAKHKAKFSLIGGYGSRRARKSRGKGL